MQNCLSKCLIVLCLLIIPRAHCPGTDSHLLSLYMVTGATLHPPTLIEIAMATISSLQKDIQDLKDLVEHAHQTNSDTRTQVSGFVSDLKNVNERLARLEGEMNSLKRYVVDLENYCISLDGIVRKHHLLLVGVNETKSKSVNLAAYRVLQVCLPEIHITDIDYCYRIGSNVKSAGRGKPTPRPIVVKLLREQHRRLIYKNRQTLRQSDVYSKVYINEDLPQVISQRRANIRAVYLNAVRKGHVAKMVGTKVMVDNISYIYRDLEILPPGLKLSDAKMIKVKGGLAFASEYAFLSNFYPCSFTFDGIEYDSAERAYQCTRARRLNAPDLAQQIFTCQNAKECKLLSHHVESTNDWDNEKQFVMKAIVRDKFTQNTHLLEKLLLTGNKTLIEATTDPFWGAAAIIGSKMLTKGKWKGANHLGTILGDFRDDFRRTDPWLDFHVPTSDEESSDISETTSGSTHDDSIQNLQATQSVGLGAVSEPESNVIHSRLSSVTTRRDRSSFAKSKKIRRGKKQSTDIIASPKSKSSPPPGMSGGDNLYSDVVAKSPLPPTPPSLRGVGAGRGRGRGRGSTPRKSHLSDAPQVGGSPPHDHVTSGNDTRTDFDFRTRSSSQTERPPTSLDHKQTSQDLNASGLLSERGMYLSSVPYWNAGFHDIPQQFMTIPEPFSSISMGGNVPLYSLPKWSAYNVTHPMLSSLGTDSPFESSGSSITRDRKSAVCSLDTSAQPNNVSTKVNETSTQLGSELSDTSKTKESLQQISTQS